MEFFCFDIISLLFAIASVFIAFKIYQKIPYKYLWWLIVGFGVLVIMRILIVISDSTGLNREFISIFGIFSIGFQMLGLYCFYRAITNFINGRK